MIQYLVLGVVAEDLCHRQKKQANLEARIVGVTMIGELLIRGRCSQDEVFPNEFALFSGLLMYSFVRTAMQCPSK